MMSVGLLLFSGETWPIHRRTRTSRLQMSWKRLKKKVLRNFRLPGSRESRAGTEDAPGEPVSSPQGQPREEPVIQLPKQEAGTQKSRAPDPPPGGRILQKRNPSLPYDASVSHSNKIQLRNRIRASRSNRATEFDGMIKGDAAVDKANLMNVNRASEVCLTEEEKEILKDAFKLTTDISRLRPSNFTPTQGGSNIAVSLDTPLPYLSLLRAQNKVVDLRLFETLHTVFGIRADTPEFSTALATNLVCRGPNREFYSYSVDLHCFQSPSGRLVFQRLRDPDLFEKNPEISKTKPLTGEFITSVLMTSIYSVKIKLINGEVEDIQAAALLMYLTRLYFALECELGFRIPLTGTTLAAEIKWYPIFLEDEPDLNVNDPENFSPVPKIGVVGPELFIPPTQAMPPEPLNLSNNTSAEAVETLPSYDESQSEAIQQGPFMEDV